jgi:phage gp37-like protein
MKKKKIIVPLLLLLAVAVYFVVFRKDKNLRYIPENADAVVLIDIKKVTGQYLFSWITHPSHWSGSKTKGKSSGSLKDSGIRIPDFLQIFHVKDSKFSEWYTVIELKDPQKFIAFLKKQKFTDKGNNRFQKDQIFIMLNGDRCIAGTSEHAFEGIQKKLLQTSSSHRVWNADQLIDNTLGSLSFISGQNIQNFSIELHDDEIEIKNNANQEIFNSMASKLQKESHFLTLELDKENIRNFTRFFNKSIADSSQASYIKATVDLERVNDTIISYEYDDNFNEVEKKTFQKITQPNYIIDIQSRNPAQTWEYFQSKKWINTENQFTAIPFQPNEIRQNNSGVAIKSTRNPVVLSAQFNENYIFIRNNALLYSSLKTLNNTEKRIISDIDYVLYGNKSQNYWVKIKARKGELPLILRW